jgi:hypothetical protein
MQNLVSELLPYEMLGPLSRDFTDDIDIPAMPRVRDVAYWFEQGPLNELGFLRAFLKARLPQLPARVQILTWTAFSRIIVKASNQEGESKYRRVQKGHPPGAIIALFIKAVWIVLKVARQLNSNMLATCGFSSSEIACTGDGNATSIRWGPVTAVTKLHDSRVSPPNLERRPSLVVTSPPYLMSWDYGLYHKFRFFWLGYDLDAYEATEVGRHLRRQDDDVERYTADMSAVFRSLTDTLLPSAHIAMINAPSVVYGKLVDTNKILTECAATCGWQLLDKLASLEIPGPHHGMYASLLPRGATAPGGSGKREHVLIFSRTGL